MAGSETGGYSSEAARERLLLRRWYQLNQNPNAATMTTMSATPTPMPALAPDDSPLDPPAFSLPASAVGVVVYDEASVRVPTGDEATTTVVTVRKPVVPSLVIGTTEVASELIEVYNTEVRVVTIVSGVNVDVASVEVSEAVALVSRHSTWCGAM